MPSLIDLTGERYGRLTVLTRATHTSHKRVCWLCCCDCGKATVVSGNDLRTGHTQSCGCYKIDTAKEKGTVHGDNRKGHRARLYTVWSGMMDRCYRPKNQKYDLYGGRGITVCTEWHDYETFRAWALLNGYRDDLTIDRKDNDGNYCPENCRWATDVEQSNNRRNNHLVTYDGETHTMAEWARIKGMSWATLQHRIYRGWSLERAFNQPVRGANKK